MEILMSINNVGITFLIILLVMVFFQVIIHNAQEAKRFKKLEEKLDQLNKRLELMRSEKK